MYIPELRIKLQNHFENYWLNECSNKPKLRTYVKYKKSFCTEPYVKYYLPRLQMSRLAQLRSGILPLRIETGVDAFTILKIMLQVKQGNLK